MKMPGFSAQASLYETSNHSHVAGSVYAAAIGEAVMPQLRPIGWTYGDCIKACDKICQFDDIGDLCGACYAICVRMPGAGGSL